MIFQSKEYIKELVENYPQFTGSIKSIVPCTLPNLSAVETNTLYVGWAYFAEVFSHSPANLNPPAGFDTWVDRLDVATTATWFDCNGVSYSLQGLSKVFVVASSFYGVVGNFVGWKVQLNSK